MTAPTFKFCNLHSLNCAAATRKQNFKSITAPLCCGNCISFRCELIDKTSGKQQNFRWRSHQLSCNFWNVNVALTRVRCTLGCFDLTLCAWSKFDILTAAAGVLAWQGIWIHFFDGLFISDFFLYSLMLRGSTGPSRDDFCLAFGFFLLR